MLNTSQNLEGILLFLPVLKAKFSIRQDLWILAKKRKVPVKIPVGYGKNAIHINLKAKKSGNKTIIITHKWRLILEIL